MEVWVKLRKLENLHIVFWLIKDTCWLMEFKILGTVMVFPTLLLAVYLALKTFKTADFYLNAAIFFWISSNSWWMLMEFYNDEIYKNYAAIPFVSGLFSIALYYLKAPAVDTNRHE